MRALTSLTTSLLLLTLCGVAAAVPQSAEDDTVYLACDKDGEPALEIMFRQTYKFIWNDSGSGADRDGWAFVVDAKKVPEGFKVLGHWMGVGGDNPNGKVQTIIVRDVSKNKDALRPPTSLAPIWDDHGSGANHDIEVFAMSAPAGYRSIGTLIRCDGGNGTGAGSVPPEPLDKKKLEQYACLRADLVDIGKITSLLWNDEGSGANKDFSAWGVTYVNPAKPDGSMRLSVGSFVGNGNHSKPEDQRAFVLRFWMPRDPVRLQEWMARASMAR